MKFEIVIEGFGAGLALKRFDMAYGAEHTKLSEEDAKWFFEADCTPLSGGNR